MIQTIKQIFNRKKTRRYLLVLASHFPIDHKRAMESTHFASLVKAENENIKPKIHAIRCEQHFWERSAQKINGGESELRICYLENSFEKAKYFRIALLNKIGVQELVFHANGEIRVDGKLVNAVTFAQNEGLSETDLRDWHKNHIDKKLCIVHFTEHRY